MALEKEGLLTHSEGVYGASRGACKTATRGVGQGSGSELKQLGTEQLNVFGCPRTFLG